MSKATNTGDKKTGGWAVRNSAQVLMLPPPEHEWAWHDLPDRVDTPDPFPEEFLKMRNTLKTNGVIKVVGEEKHQWPNGSRSFRSVWTVKDAVWRLAAKAHRTKLRSDRALPCGHVDGFRTIDADRGVYECGNDYCTEQYDRATIKELNL